MADLNAYFKSIIDQDREAVVICDLDHTILYMNPAAVVDYKKYGGAALLGKSLLACHNPNSVEAIRKVVEWFAAGASPPATTSSIPITTQSTTAMSTWLPCGTRTVP